MTALGFALANRHVGPGHPPFVVAEMSGNHRQSLDTALAIVDAAAQAGAHALKIQTYTADTMTLDVKEKEFMVSADNPLWGGKSLHDLYNIAYTPWEWHEPIFARAKSHGLIPFSSPFGASAVDFLESLDVPCYKIASFENTDHPLIAKAAQTGKPLIVSTGMATVAELDDAVRVARENGCKDLLLLKCTSTYPADPGESHLRTIPHMAAMFDCPVGLSDHTLGVGAAVGAVALGAVLVEKHFTLSRADGGVDAAFSLEPEELRALVVETEVAWRALGEVHYGPTAREADSLVFRRSLYIAEDMKAGERFSQENLRVIRPGLGLAPKYLPLLLGKKILVNAPKGTAVQWHMVLGE